MENPYQVMQECWSPLEDEQKLWTEFSSCEDLPAGYLAAHIIQGRRAKAVTIDEIPKRVPGT